MTVAHLDNDAAFCRLGGPRCTEQVLGHGGLDEHHAWPEFMGGPVHQDEPPLCPNHHRRQHALLRYLVELADTTPAHAVIKAYSKAERDMAVAAVAKWRAAGSPRIAGWGVPAAR